MQRRTPTITALRDPGSFFGILPFIKGPLFLLEEDWTFQFWDGTRYHSMLVPEGYQFDKASIPPVLWGPPFNFLPDGLCTVPSLEHDLLCNLYHGGSPWLHERIDPPPPLTAKAIHAHFYYRLLEYNMSPTKARLMWEGVRKFGPGSWLRPSTYKNRQKHDTTKV
jgi:hypothetical protein